MNAGMKRIGIWNTAFLGDAVLTLPLIQVVAAAFPGAAIDFHVRRGVGSLFAAQPRITVHEYDKRGSERGGRAFFRYGRRLAERRYDLWLNAHPGPRSALLALLSGATVRIGYDTGPLSRLCSTSTVSRRFTELDEIERLLELVRPVLPPDFSFTETFGDFCTSERPGQGGLPPLPAPWPELVLPESSRQKAASFRNSHPGPLLGIHPGSIWGTKRWPPAAFAETARRAVQQGAQVLLFTGPDERELAAEVVRLSGLEGHRRLHVFPGTLSLPDLAALIACLDCYLANDSGLTHVAWILRTPLTALFGPTVRELGFFPRGNSSRVLETQLDCRPCGRHGHRFCPRGHHNCMKRISPDEVWADVRHKLFG